MTAATAAGTLLGGRLRYEQPVEGYRTGIEPVFLAAAVPARPGERVLEGGTGAGAALLCLAARVPGLVGLGVERNPGMAAIARRNIAGVSGLSVVCGAVESLEGVLPFDHACANPPWHDPAGTPSPNPERRAALQAVDAGTLTGWCRALLRHVRPGGTITLVLAARLAGTACRVLKTGGGGGIAIRALVPKEDRAAKIVLIHAIAESGASDRTLPALTLHLSTGGYTAAAEAILRDGSALSWDA